MKYMQVSNCEQNPYWSAITRSVDEFSECSFPKFTKRSNSSQFISTSSSSWGTTTLLLSLSNPLQFGTSEMSDVQSLFACRAVLGTSESPSGIVPASLPGSTPDESLEQPGIGTVFCLLSEDGEHAKDFDSVEGTSLIDCIVALILFR